MLDTSVLVAALVEAHPQHQRAFAWLSKSRQPDIKVCVATHALAELYAVLTTLPIRPRIRPDTARRLIREDVEASFEVVALAPADYKAVLDAMSELSVTGGAIYDALSAHAAQKSNADCLLTFDVADLRRVWPEGEDRIEEP